MIPIFVYFFPFFSFRFELASIKVSKVAWIAEDCAIVDKSLSEHIYIYISCRGTRHVGYQNGQSDSFRNLFAIEIFKYMCVYICREIIYRAKSNVF